jgi:hypothetical protein
LTPEPSVAAGGVGQGDVVASGELAESGDVRAGVVVDIAFAVQAHPIGADVVGRQEDPLGGDVLEVVEEAAVLRFDLVRVEAGVVDELGHDEVGAGGEDFFGVVVRAAWGFSEVAAGVATAPGFGDEFDSGLGVGQAETGDELLLPAVLARVGQVAAVGDAVAPGGSWEAPSTS